MQIVLTTAGNFVQGLKPFWLILISAAHFNGLVGDASSFGQGLQTGFSSIKVICRVTVHQVDDVINLSLWFAGSAGASGSAGVCRNPPWTRP